ncbi:MAG: hypothetical protein ACRBCJ_03515 [Hyphomicrobiaceae bacterium]
MFKGLANRWGRQLFVAGLTAILTLAGTSAFSAELPRNPDELVRVIREAIETSDYERIRQIVYWENVSSIKRRIVRFQIRRGLGRPIRSISFEDFPKGGLKGVNATGKLMANMPVTNRVRVVYDEPPIEMTGKPPTYVYLIGKVDDAYRISLVVRKPGVDDDD